MSKVRLIFPMTFRFLTLTCVVTTATFAADAPKLPSIPTEPIAKKKELLFSDDFERADLGKDKGWAIVVPTFSLDNGTLKGTQMRSEAPAARFGGALLRRRPNVCGRRWCGTGPENPLWAR